MKLTDKLENIIKFLFWVIDVVYMEKSRFTTLDLLL